MHMVIDIHGCEAVPAYVSSTWVELVSNFGSHHLGLSVGTSHGGSVLQVMECLNAR